MREGWKEVELGYVCNYVKDKTSFLNVNERNYISADNMVSNFGGITNSEYVPSKGTVSSFKSKDILVSNIRPYFKKIWYASFDGGCSNDVFILRTDEKNAYSKFLFYLISQQEFFDYMMAGANGTKMPRGNKNSIIKFKFLLPPLETQRKIAKILSNYDDLIENNLKRIKILEEMAQQTFRNFVKNGSAKNWESKSLETLIDFHIGGGWGEEEFSNEFSETGYVIRGTDIDSLKKGENSKVPYRFHKISNIKSRQLEDGDIVFEVSGGSSNEGVAKSFLITSEVLQFFNDKVICASFCKLIRLKDRSLSHFFYYFLQYLRESKTTEIYEKRSASNIVNYNWEAFLKYQKILLPNPNEIKEFNDKVVKILKLTNLLGAKNQRLREARDILLPRLMMGLVDVHNIDL